MPGRELYDPPTFFTWNFNSFFYNCFIFYFQVVKETFYTHAKKAQEEANIIKKEKSEAEKRLKDIQQKKEQERMEKDFTPASVTEVSEQEAVKIQEDIEKEKKTSKLTY